MSVAIAQAAVRKIDEHAAIVDIHSDITGENEAALIDSFVEASRAGCRVIILNLSEARHVGSRCLELLIILLTHARRQNLRLLTYGQTAQYERMLATSGLDQDVAVYQSENEAVAATTSMID
jgi:anti-anti-sigma factor